MLHFCLVLLLIGLCQSKRNDYSQEALGDAITSLPGLSAATLANYTMFSGYIDVCHYCDNRST